MTTHNRAHSALDIVDETGAYTPEYVRRIAAHTDPLLRGPHCEDWHFRSSHLPLSNLRIEAAGYAQIALEIADRLRRSPYSAAQLDLQVHRDIYVAMLPAGSTLPTHSHSDAGACYVVSGQLRIVSFPGDGDAGDSGVREVSGGGVWTPTQQNSGTPDRTAIARQRNEDLTRLHPFSHVFGMKASHRIEVLAPTILVAIYSPGLTGLACHEYLPKPSNSRLHISRPQAVWRNNRQLPSTGQMRQNPAH